jgi:hypothetical protein
MKGLALIKQLLNIPAKLLLIGIDTPALLVQTNAEMNRTAPARDRGIP